MLCRYLGFFGPQLIARLENDQQRQACVPQTQPSAQNPSPLPRSNKHGARIELHTIFCASFSSTCCHRPESGKSRSSPTPSLLSFYGASLCSQGLMASDKNKMFSCDAHKIELDMGSPLKLFRIRGKRKGDSQRQEKRKLPRVIPSTEYTLGDGKKTRNDSGTHATLVYLEPATNPLESTHPRNRPRPCSAKSRVALRGTRSCLQQPVSTRSWKWRFCHHGLPPLLFQLCQSILSYVAGD